MMFGSQIRTVNFSESGVELGFVEPVFTEPQSETIQHDPAPNVGRKKEDITIVQTADLAAAQTREQEYLAIIEKYEDIESQLDLHTSHSAKLKK